MASIDLIIGFLFLPIVSTDFIIIITKLTAALQVDRSAQPPLYILTVPSAAVSQEAMQTGCKKKGGGGDYYKTGTIQKIMRQVTIKMAYFENG